MVLFRQKFVHRTVNMQGNKNSGSALQTGFQDGNSSAQKTFKIRATFWIRLAPTGRSVLGAASS